MKILLIAGARPNFMKIAPLVHALAKNNRKVEFKVVHTGQHYDCEMSGSFFEDFDLPKPDYFLDVGSGSHALQTANVMIAFEKVCLDERPEIVVVVGDINSTLACAITAKKLNIKVAHVESGLRSGDMTMPEEINRIVTDSISDYLFVTERSGIDNLKMEGKSEEQVFFVGNIMIDTLYYSLEKLKGHTVNNSKNIKYQNAGNSSYAVATLHRPSNVDTIDTLKDILSALSEISKEMNLYFPVHPRTRKNIEKFNLNSFLKNSNIITMPALPYLEFLALWKGASLVLTDSGGIQEETTALGIPCFTVRENTERPITIEEGTNILVGATGKGILNAFNEFKMSKKKEGNVPALWDGKTAERIIRHLIG